MAWHDWSQPLPGQAHLQVHPALPKKALPCFHKAPPPPSFTPKPACSGWSKLTLFGQCNRGWICPPGAGAGLRASLADARVIMNMLYGPFVTLGSRHRGPVLAYLASGLCSKSVTKAQSPFKCGWVFTLEETTATVYTDFGSSHPDWKPRIAY